MAKTLKVFVDGLREEIERLIEEKLASGLDLSAEDIAALLSSSGGGATRLGDKTISEEPTDDIHNERWLARPIGSISAARWDDENDCYIPGKGSVRLMRCERDGTEFQWKDHYRLQEVHNPCPELIPERLEYDCGDPINVPSNASPSAVTGNLDESCQRFFASFSAVGITDSNPITLTFRQDGNVVATQVVDASQAYVVEWDSNGGTNLAIDNLVFSTNGSAGVQGLTIQGRTDQPNFLDIWQTTECCKWWCRPCVLATDGGSGTSEPADTSALEACVCALIDKLEETGAFNEAAADEVRGSCNCKATVDCVKCMGGKGPETWVASFPSMSMNPAWAANATPAEQAIWQTLVDNAPNETVTLTYQGGCLWTGHEKIGDIDVLVDFSTIGNISVRLVDNAVPSSGFFLYENNFTLNDDDSVDCDEAQQDTIEDIFGFSPVNAFDLVATP